MSLMEVVDYSKYQGTVSLDSHRAMKAAGIEAAVVGLWHGIDANPYALNSLANAKRAGLLVGGYIVVVARDAREVVQAGKAAAGAHWKDMFGVAIDVEIRGITEVNLANAFDEVVRQGQRPFLYTGNWFWDIWRAELGHYPNASKYGAWLAVYNGTKTLESAGTRPGYGPVVGHQYKGSTSAFGTTVDFNVFDRDWVLAVQEDDMTIAELAAVLRSIKVKRDKRVLLTADEEALYNNMVALQANIAMDYIDNTLSVPQGRKGQQDAWSRMVRHPHPEDDSPTHVHEATVSSKVTLA